MSHQNFFSFAFFFNLLLWNGRSRSFLQANQKFLVGVIFPSLMEGQLLIIDLHWLVWQSVLDHVGRQPWSSIFQFRRTKSRIQFDNLFWFISLLSTTKKKFPKINLHDSELMTYVHIHGRQLPKLLLHIQYYHWWLEIPMGIWIIAS